MIGPRLDAAMRFLNRFVRLSFYIPEITGTLLFEIELDIIMQRALIALQGKHIISFFGNDFRCDFALASHRIDGDDGAFNRESNPTTPGSP